MSERLIKKYPNRRLYDTVQSKYITLAELKELVIQGDTIKVVDSNSNEDLTRAILFQIIQEAEAGGKPLFTSPMLAQIIRFYGGTVQGLFARYLEESLQLFTRQQEHLRDTLGKDPLSQMTRMAEQNMKFWTDMQSQFFKSAGFSGSKKEPEK
jgi:polyhydroxyalkanoate synthesis repressor PhaR